MLLIVNHCHEILSTLKRKGNKVTLSGRLDAVISCTVAQNCNFSHTLNVPIELNVFFSHNKSCIPVCHSELVFMWSRSFCMILCQFFHIWRCVRQYGCNYQMCVSLPFLTCNVRMCSYKLTYC